MIADGGRRCYNDATSDRQSLLAVPATASGNLARRQVPLDPVVKDRGYLMDLWEHYQRPSSVDEAVAVLQAAGPDARVIAGGTDLLIDLQQGRKPPVHTLVDICQINELARIEQHEDSIAIGAAVTHNAIVKSALLQQHATCLVEACGVIGGPQVRNVATLGGNIAHGLPAADGTIALLALGAEAEVAGPRGRQWVELESLFEAPGRTVLERDGAILTRVRFRLSGPAEGSAFFRVMRPQGIAIAILNLAAWIRLDDRARVVDARIALAPAGPRPRRSELAAQALLGRSVDHDSLADTAAALLSDAQLRTSPHRATQAYREHLVGTLLERTLSSACNRASRALEMEVDYGG
ncbi:MAG: xanthine dehydrogenase family protein subunit M [Anaerolineales bacterium]